MEQAEREAKEKAGSLMKELAACRAKLSQVRGGGGRGEGVGVGREGDQ